MNFYLETTNYRYDVMSLIPKVELESLIGYIYFSSKKSMDDVIMELSFLENSVFNIYNIEKMVDGEYVEVDE